MLVSGQLLFLKLLIIRGKPGPKRDDNQKPGPKRPPPPRPAPARPKPPVKASTQVNKVEEILVASAPVDAGQSVEVEALDDFDPMVKESVKPLKPSRPAPPKRPALPKRDADGPKAPLSLPPPESPKPKPKPKVDIIHASAKKDKQVLSWAYLFCNTLFQPLYVTLETGKEMTLLLQENDFQLISLCIPLICLLNYELILKRKVTS